MEMDNIKKSLKMGVLSGACSYALYVVFVLCIGFITKWHSFWVITGESAVLRFQPHNSISWEMTTIVGLVLASLVPVCMMRYEKIKYAFSYIGISLIACVWLYGTTLGAYYMIGDMMKTVLNCPFATFDSIYYFVFVFLLGSVIGTVVSFIMNFMRNRD